MRIFVSATAGLDAERAALDRVAERLNQRRGIEPGSPLHLEVIDWGRHVAPLLSDHGAVLQKPPATAEDVFLGLAWLRFSPPTSGQFALKKKTVPASERDFELAYRFWSRLDRPQCLFWRAVHLPQSLTEIDGLELDRVARFFSRFHPGEEGPFLYREFRGAEELEAELEKALAAIVEKRHRDAAKVTAPEPSPSAEAEEKERDPATGMTAGKAYAISLLDLEIAGHAELRKAHGSRPEALEGLERAFEQLVRENAGEYGGHPLRWSAKGGLVIFRGKRSFDRSVMTGLKVLHNLPVFNLDPQQNPLPSAIEVRAAVGEADILFRLPVSEITSADIDFTSDLQRRATHPGELSLAKRSLGHLDQRLAGRFKPKGRFDGEVVYVCRLPATNREAQAADVEDFIAKLKHQTSLVDSILGAPGSPIEVASAESIGAVADEVYAILNKFCQTFTAVDPDWTREFISQLGDGAALLRHEEGRLWQRLRRHYAENKAASGGASPKLHAMVQAASRRRSRPVVILEKLEERCRMLVAGEAAGPSAEAGGELRKKIEQFVRADELDVETALTDLLLNHKNDLAEILLAPPSEPYHQRLVDKLWETADLVLLDDLHSIRGHRRASDSELFDALTQGASPDARFRITRDLLAVEEDLDRPGVVERFRELGLEPTEADLQVIWRSLLVGHGDDAQRLRAAFKLSPDSMWQAISHPNAPLESLYAIGQRASKSGREDIQKIYFDCIRARLDAAVEAFRTREELSALTNLVLLLLDFPFLVESGYFERFDDVLGKFLARAQKAGMRVEYFENVRSKLETLHADADEKGPSKLPSGIKSLPLTLQRRLAAEPRYLFWFLSHPDLRIAGETLKHVSLANVERVLRVREINGAVMSAILRRPEFFARSQPLVAALNHPKCDQGFAAKHVPSMARSRGGLAELEKITRNSSANPAVRSLAQRALKNRTAAGKR